MLAQIIIKEREDYNELIIEVPIVLEKAYVTFVYGDKQSLVIRDGYEVLV